MRYVSGKLELPVVPDSVATFLLGANTAQAMDYPSGADFMHVTFCSSLGAVLGGVVNGNSTHAAWGTSQSGTAASSLASMLVPPGVGEGRFQRPRASTGFSVVSPTSGYCYVAFWSRAGTTGQ